jgi:glycosyltransferase involved in cell wall biosynthesis
MYSPICLFTYNRLTETRQTVNALQDNFLASKSDLIIFSDAGKDKASWVKVNAVRKFLHTVSGFKTIRIIETPLNKGLANSIISGVTTVIEEYGKVIVLEDDLITSTNFLDFMNQSLDYYEKSAKVLSISGYSFSNNNLKQNSDVIFGVRASSWGWATWRDRWVNVDWEVKSYPAFKYNFLRRIQFNKGGSDMSHMLDKQMKGKINSWAIRFCYHQFEHNLVDVYPVSSKVTNIGIGEKATNSKTGTFRFKTVLDKTDNRYFKFNEFIKISTKDLQLFRRRYSITMRIIDHLISSKSFIKNSDLVVFHPALAPYRIDFFNKLAEQYNSKFYFSLSNPKEQKFDQEAIRNELKFKFNLTNFGFELFCRTIRFGTWFKLFLHKPNFVICSEYSYTTILVLLYKIIFNKKIKVYTICDDSLDLSKQREGIRKWIRTVCSNYLDGIIFPSQKVCDWYRINVSLKPKTLELPIIHDNDTFRMKLNNALDYSNIYVDKYNLIGKKVFLFVGRLVAIKNIDLLIRSFAKANLASGVLIIVGDGEEREKLIQLVKALNLQDKCVYTGRLEGNELLSWFNVAQCFVLPSYIEPYGAVVNEALLAGCKVICSDLAGSSELITNENGSIFNPHSEIELTNLIQKTATEIESVKLPLFVKDDSMPYKFESKLNELILSL